MVGWVRPRGFGQPCNRANYAIFLHGLVCSSPGWPGLFRVYSGSWELPGDCLHVAGDGLRLVRAGSRLVLGFWPKCP